MTVPYITSVLTLSGSDGVEKSRFELIYITFNPGVKHHQSWLQNIIQSR